MVYSILQIRRRPLALSLPTTGGKGTYINRKVTEGFNLKGRFPFLIYEYKLDLSTSTQRYASPMNRQKKLVQLQKKRLRNPEKRLQDSKKEKYISKAERAKLALEAENTTQGIERVERINGVKLD
jgi:DUF2986 family protein